MASLGKFLPRLRRAAAIIEWRPFLQHSQVARCVTVCEQKPCARLDPVGYESSGGSIYLEGNKMESLAAPSINYSLAAAGGRKRALRFLLLQSMGDSGSQ